MEGGDVEAAEAPFSGRRIHKGNEGVCRKTAGIGDGKVGETE